jgi:hypothetical protein
MAFKGKSTMSKLQSFAAVATIIGVIIAAIALIPAFGQWLAPRVPTLSSIAISTPAQDSGSQQSPTSVSRLPTDLPSTTATSQPTAQSSLSDEEIQKRVLKQTSLITSYKGFGVQQSVTDGAEYFITSELNTTGIRQVYRSGESSDSTVLAESVSVGTDSCTRQAGKDWECSKMGGYDIGRSRLGQIVLGNGYLDGADSTDHGMNRVTVDGRPCVEYWMEQKRESWVWRDEVAFDLDTFFPIQIVSNNVRLEGGIEKQGLKNSNKVYDVNIPVQISLPK